MIKNDTIINRNGRNGSMTSRERVLAAFQRKPVDYVPCCLSFNSLMPEQRRGYKYQFPFIDSMPERLDYCCNTLGTDQMVNVSIDRYYPDKDVSVNKWFQNNEIHKKWITPSGELYAVVKYDEKWPFGFDIPFYHDMTGHYIKPWLSTASDLECLKHILRPLRTKEQLEEVKFNFMQLKRLADQYQLAIISHIGTGLTGALQMFTPTELCYKVMDEPDLVDGYLGLEHDVNMKHMEIMLELGADIIGRNGFYETADFYSPEMLKHLVGKRLQEEINIVHEAGKLIGYTAHTGVTQIIKNLSELDFDCIMHLDIAHGSNDIHRISKELCNKKSIIAGPSNTYHMWSDDVNIIRKAVDDVFEVFGKVGLLISACPSSHSIMPWENTLAIVDEWKMLR
ncbi:MAG: uroporphyrinogen decarboxylase family protein [Clostridiaceae bacterium]